MNHPASRPEAGLQKHYGKECRAVNGILASGNQAGDKMEFRNKEADCKTLYVLLAGRNTEADH